MANSATYIHGDDIRSVTVSMIASVNAHVLSFCPVHSLGFPKPGAYPGVGIGHNPCPDSCAPSIAVHGIRYILPN
jgi:hypothetical protein